MRRYVCPTCGSGLNAPERMRTSDVRRYCLSCSADSGFLVERKSPALERRRAAAALRSSEKARERREKAKLAKMTKLMNARGETVYVDLAAEVRRALREMGWRSRYDRVQVDVRLRRDGLYSGRAMPWENRIVLSVGYYIGSYEDALVLAYHEAAHIAAGSDARDPRGRNWHGERFQKTLSAALQKRWPFVRYGSLRQRSGYEPGWNVRGQLFEHVRNGGEL